MTELLVLAGILAVIWVLMVLGRSVHERPSNAAAETPRKPRTVDPYSTSAVDEMLRWKDGGPL